MINESLPEKGKELKEEINVYTEQEGNAFADELFEYLRVMNRIFLEQIKRD